MDEQSELVQVFVRIRPENETEAKLPGSSPNRHLNSPNGRPYNVSSGCCISASDDKTIRLIAPDNLYSTRKSVSAVDDKIYSFDKVFLEDSTQEQIYASVADHVLATVRGYNSTIFAYGVTGSGKSFTMTGNKQCPGIIPRAIGDIFRHIDQAAADSDVIFYVRLSYVELYNNSFRNLLEHVSKEQNMNKSTSSANASSFFSEMDDLEAYEAHLGPTFAYARATSAASLKEYPGASTRSEKIEVRETQNAGVFLSGPNLRFPVTSAVDAFQLINKGNKMRAVSSTNCNDQSSRYVFAFVQRIVLLLPFIPYLSLPTTGVTPFLHFTSRVDSWKAPCPLILPRSLKCALAKFTSWIWLVVSAWPFQEPREKPLLRRKILIRHSLRWEMSCRHFRGMPLRRVIKHVHC